MGFWKRILNTKKIKELKEAIADTTAKIDDKLEISEKVESVKKVASETTQKVAQKIEYSLDGKISFDTFTQVELRIGEILSAEKVVKSDKLLKLEVDFAEDKPRQIVSGIATSYSPEELVGKKVLFATNIEPRKIFGLESDGMILGVSLSSRANEDHENS